MTMYHFVTRWFFDVPLEKLWQEVQEVEAWPEWFRSFKYVKIRDPEPVLRLGSVVDCEVKGFLPYTLRFQIEVTSFEPPHIMEVAASGDLIGGGKWVLEDREGGTSATYYWDVATTNPILNLLSRLPFAKALVERNHDYVMNKAYLALKPRVEA